MSRTLNQLISDGQQHNSYTWYHPTLVRFWFPWCIVMFVINNYYVIECVLVPTFYSYYQLTISTLLPLNIIFMLLLSVDLVLKVFMTPRPESLQANFRWKSKINRLFSKHFLVYYLFYDLYVVDLIIFILYVSSFIVPYEVAKYTRMAVAFKLIAVVKFNQVIYKRFHVYRWVRQLYTLIKMMYVILLFSHYFGCAFYIIDTLLMQSEAFGSPILNPQNYYQMQSLCYTPIASLSDVQKYIYANYFITALITTIAYGDIVGKNYIQEIFVLFLLVLSTISIALILEQFMIMMQSNRFALFEVIKQYNCVKEFMNQKDVPFEIQSKVRNYLFYVEYEKNFYSHESIVEKLSTKLRGDLMYEAYGKAICRCFNSIGLTDTYKLCGLLHQTAYQAQFDIYNPFQRRASLGLYEQDNNDDYHEQMFHPDLLIPLQKHIVRFIRCQPTAKDIILPGQVFCCNLYELLTEQKVRYGYRTNELTKFIKLTSQSFKKYLADNALLRKQLRQNKQKILCRQISNTLTHNECLLCDRLDHSLEECPDAHYIISDRIQFAQKFTTVLTQQISEHSLHLYSRKQSRSRKLINVSYYSPVTQDVSKDKSISAPQVKHQQRQPNLILKIYLQSLAKSFMEISELKKNVVHKPRYTLQDSIYDPQGLQEAYSLPSM